MANKVPVKANYTNGNVTSLGEFVSGDTLDVSYIADGTITAAKLAADTATQAELDTVSGVASAALPKAGGTMTGTIASFTSTGIDDNADATAITIDSSEDITFSKNRANVVSNVTLHNVNAAGFGTGIDFSCAYNGGYDLAKIDTENSSTGGQLRFYTSNTSGTITERMKINHLGKVTISNSATTGTDTDTSNSGSVTLDFDINQNFVLTLTGNVTLANPTTETIGQSGFIAFIQDGTGSRTVSLGTDYETAGAAGLTLTATASATDLVPYLVVASGRILLGTPQLAFA